MNFNNKKYNWVVSGGAGFIGSNLCKMLIEHKQNVICIDNFFTGNKKNILELSRSKNFRLLKSDIKNIKIKNFKNRVDYFIHLAALGSVARSFANPKETNSVNVEGSFNTLEISKKLNVKKFIFASSSSVYGNLKKEFKVENDPTIPISPYGLSKLAFEKYAEILSANSNTKIVGLRFFNVFGPNQNVKGSYAAVIPLWCSKILRSKKIRLNGNGETSRDFTYIENVLEGIIKSCFYKQVNKYEIFNLACGDEIKLNQLIKNIAKITNKKIKIEKKPFRTGDIKRSKANINKAKKKLKYRVNTNFYNGIKKYLNHLQN